MGMGIDIGMPGIIPHGWAPTAQDGGAQDNHRSIDHQPTQHCWCDASCVRGLNSPNMGIQGIHGIVQGMSSGMGVFPLLPRALLLPALFSWGSDTDLCSPLELGTARDSDTAILADVQNGPTTLQPPTSFAVVFS